MDGIIYLGLVEDDALELDVAALQIAALDHADEELASEVDLLGTLAERLAVVGGQARTAGEQAAALSAVLAGEHGFIGDTQTYDDPANSDMIRVLDRRRGLPISLSILYVSAARRIGWQAEVLNTPGHVLIRVGSSPDALILDPFDRGRVVGGDPADAAWPAAMSNRAALVRLLANAAIRAEAAGNEARALEIYGRMTTVAPAHLDGWWERARLELASGAVPAARGSLSAMLEVTRDPTTRRRIASALGALAAAR